MVCVLGDNRTARQDDSLSVPRRPAADGLTE